MSRSLQRFLLSLLALLAIALWSSVAVRPQASGVLTMRVLDVGQGDAILLSTPLGRQVLVDAGPDAGVLQSLDRVLPLTRRVIDLAVISHHHSDHIGGMAAVLDHYPVRQLWLSGAVHTTATYQHLLRAVERRHVPTSVVSAGDATTIDGVQLTVFYPLMPQIGTRPENQHDATVVVLVEYGERSFLLTGDLEAEHEADILASGQLTDPVDVLKVGHHGSKSSTSEAWLDHLQPSVAIISVGRDNKFHHPHPTVVERLTSRSSQLFRTDQQGTVSVHTDGHQLWTETEK